MPQMSPLLWLNLMFTFVMLLTMLNSLNYFSTMYKQNWKLIYKNKKNWKW